MMLSAKRVYYATTYYLSWLFFGLVGLGLNMVCALLLVLPRRLSLAACVRRVIRLLFDYWVKWLYASGVVRVRWFGFEQPLEPGVVYVANHPMLIDAPVLLARLPNAVCIFKPSIMRNPVLGPAAIMADYVSGRVGIDVIRDAARRVASGCSILIFPEGTRTAPGVAPGDFKPGFAVIAAKAKAPVQLILIRATPELTVRGRAWWKLPSVLPAQVEVVLDQRWEHVEGRHRSVLKAEVEKRLSEALHFQAP